MDSNLSSISSSLLPALLSQYEKSIEPGQTSSSATDAKTSLENFSTMLRLSMEKELTSMISTFSSSGDDNSSDSSSDDNSSSLNSLLNGSSSNSSSLSSLLGGSQDSSSLSSLLSGLGSSTNSTTTELLNSLLSSTNSSSDSSSSLLSSLLGSSGNASSLLSSLLSGQTSTGSLSNSLSDSNSSSLDAILGSSSSYQQLLARQKLKNYLNNNTTTNNSPVSAQIAHINQFQADLANGGDGKNADSGPASLVMALHEMGVLVPGETTITSNGQAINLARLSMVNDSSKDGLDSNGIYSDAEHNVDTTLADVSRGAVNAGLKSSALSANSSDIMHYLQEGGRVVVSGTFTGKEPLPWTGDSSTDKATAPGGVGDHTVEVSSYDTFSKLFTINDPARSAPLQVTSATLDYYMSGNAGAVGIRK